MVMQDISTEMDESQGQAAVIAQIAAKAQELQSSLATASNYANLILSEVAIPEASVQADSASGRQGLEAQRGVTAGIAGQKFLLRLRASVERTAQMADDLVRLATGPPGHRARGAATKGESRSSSGERGCGCQPPYRESSGRLTASDQRQGPGPGPGPA